MPFLFAAQALSQSGKCSCWTIYVTFPCAASVPVGVALVSLSSQLLFGPGLCLFPSWRWMLHGAAPFGSFCSVKGNFSTLARQWHFLIKGVCSLLKPILSSQSDTWILRVEILLLFSYFS